MIKIADMRPDNEYIYIYQEALSFCWYFIADVSGDTGDILMVGTADGWTRLYIYSTQSLEIYVSRLKLGNAIRIYLPK